MKLFLFQTIWFVSYFCSVTCYTTVHRSRLPFHTGSHSQTSLQDASALKNERKQFFQMLHFSKCYSHVRHCLGSTAINNDYVTIDDLEAIQQLFTKYCDGEGLMTRENAMKVPFIADILADESLLPEEFDSIWNRVPKFPDTETQSERIDVDSWVQLFRDIDDLFEDDKYEQSEAVSSDESTVDLTKVDVDSSISSIGTDSFGGLTKASELEMIFSTISDPEGRISKESLVNWNEISELINDGLLSLEEFEVLWSNSRKGDATHLDFEEFVDFNSALDALFIIEDADELDKDSTSSPVNSSSIDGNISTRRMVEGSIMDQEALFLALADSDGLIGYDELNLWSELQDMLSSGDLLQSELDEFFGKAEKSENDESRLNKKGFKWLCNSINDLFESDTNDTVNREDVIESETFSLKSDLLETIDNLYDDEKLPCGLEADDRERKQILAIVDEMEVDKGNLVRELQGNINPYDLIGSWELLYSSSSAMRFNKGLTGLGGSFPNGKFGSLIQNLKATKFMMDVEYLEEIKVKPSTASFDVKVNGSWGIRRSTSLFTGEPSVVMYVEPDRVTYGPTSTRADHWKSLGPMNMLDITYLDDDLRIMRGNTSVETIFIFRRKK